jgi:hypothetical protein
MCDNRDFSEGYALSGREVPLSRARHGAEGQGRRIDGVSVDEKGLEQDILGFGRGDSLIDHDQQVPS